MKIYWCKCGPRGGNFGDTLTSLLLDYCDVPHEWASPRSAELVGIGSVLSHITPIFQGSVWTSGAIRIGAQCDLLSANVVALRGHLSLKQTSVRNRQRVCLGDGGLLAYLLHRTSHKRYTIGLVPHYTQQNDPLVRAISERDNVHLIDICGDPHNIVSEIAQCQCVLSSSLHGLIVADSLGVPNRWVEFPSSEAHIIGGRFKFRDYYSVFGLDDVEPVCISAAHDVDSQRELIGDYDRPGIEDIKRSLLESLREIAAPHSQLPWHVASQPIAERDVEILSRIGDGANCQPRSAVEPELGQLSTSAPTPQPLSHVRDTICRELESTLQFFIGCLDVLADCHHRGIAHGSVSEDSIMVLSGSAVFRRFGWRPPNTPDSPIPKSRFAEYCQDDLFALGKVMSRAASHWAPCRIVADLLTHPDREARLTNLRVARSLLASALLDHRGDHNPVETQESSADRAAMRQLLHFMVSQNQQLALCRDLHRQSQETNRSLEIRLAAQELLEQARSPHAVIVIDEEQWRTDLPGNIPTLPFVERSGEYWGLPDDDACAIAELERLRLPAERFLAILQPSFWWLEHYRAFSDHLHASSRLVFKSDRLWLFELFGTTTAQERGSMGCGRER